MSVLSALYKHGLWISIPLFALGVVLLWWSIISVIRLGERSRILDVPLAPQQDVEFAEAGVVDLWVDGPVLSARFAGLTYSLKGADGSSVAGRATVPLSWRRSTSLSGQPRHRRAEWIFTIPRPGGYALHVEGLGTVRTGDEDHRLVFMRPHLPHMIGYVLGIVVGALLTVGSLVLFLLRLTTQSEGA